MGNEKVLCPSCKKRYIGEDFALCGVCAGVEKEDKDIYIDNNIYITDDNISSVRPHIRESTELELDISDGMTEEEVRKVVEEVLYNEYVGKLSYQQREVLRHRVNRFYVKTMAGVAVGYSKKMRFRLFVCTESDEAVEELDARRLFNKFFTMLRYHCPDLQYCVVEHRQGDCWRRNWHVFSYGTDKIPFEVIDRWWKENYSSMVRRLEEVKDEKKVVAYLAEYLGKPEKYIRSFRSLGWIFPGYMGFSSRYHKEQGTWPDKDSLVKLATMPKSKRKFEEEYLINTGNMSSKYK
jgi:hypothetical protein